MFFFPFLFSDLTHKSNSCYSEENVKKVIRFSTNPSNPLLSSTFPKPLFTSIWFTFCYGFKIKSSSGGREKINCEKRNKKKKWWNHMSRERYWWRIEVYEMSSIPVGSLRLWELLSDIEDLHFTYETRLIDSELWSI